MQKKPKKQTNKQTKNQPTKQTNKQRSNKQTKNQPTKQTNKQKTNKQTEIKQCLNEVNTIFLNNQNQAKAKQKTLSMMVYNFNPSIQQEEEGGSLSLKAAWSTGRVPGWSRLHRETLT